MRDDFKLADDVGVGTYRILEWVSQFGRHREDEKGKELVFAAKCLRREWTSWKSTSVNGMRVDTSDFNKMKRHSHNLVLAQVNVYCVNAFGACYVCISCFFNLIVCFLGYFFVVSLSVRFLCNFFVVSFSVRFLCIFFAFSHGFQNMCTLLIILLSNRLQTISLRTAMSM